MKRSIWQWQLSGFAVTSFLGTLLHFIYDWLGRSAWIAPFSGVNESTWEHMKLLFWPMFIFAIIQSFFFRDLKNFWHVKCKGILLGIIIIPIIFYTLNGVIGQTPDWINISIFFLSAALAYIYESHLFATKTTGFKKDKSPIIILCTVAVLFIIFTFITPKIGLFKDPLTGSYGI